MNNPSQFKASSVAGRIVFWLLIALTLFFFLFPLYWMFLSSIKQPGDVTSLPPRFIPFVQFKPTLANYAAVLSTSAMGSRQNTFPWALLNSVLVGGTATVVAVILGTLTAYAFSRFRVKGESDLLFFILSTRMLPPVVVLVPIFLMFTNLGLPNTFAGITLLYIISGLPFVVWMMKGFFDEIPREYEDAAMVDGYSRLEAVWKIVFPEAFPAMLATAVFVLITAWNEFVFVTLLNKQSWGTVPPFLYQIIGYGRTEWSRMAAAAIIYITPIVVFTFVVRNHLLRGVTFGAVRR
ncbi:MAG TPA: carbohydrate ABC transporter permease [Anaerolineae bacterium]|nr:carbohydrate ABC transporter permease [Anaerolineae bacterium]